MELFTEGNWGACPNPSIFTPRNTQQAMQSAAGRHEMDEMRQFLASWTSGGFPFGSLSRPKFRTKHEFLSSIRLVGKVPAIPVGM